MLVHLQIRDFAIIDAVELELGGGLTALTGETGAGKSIVVDAVMLALGARASAEAVRHGAERAEITATFEAGADPAVRRWLEEQSIAAEGGEIVLRRVLGADGRSRQYVNGRLLPAQPVRELGERLVEIHGQQEFQSLVRRDAQRAMLDAHGGHDALLAPVEAAAAEWRHLCEERDSLAALARDRGARLELLRYQVGELEALAVAPGEVAGLVEERARLANRGRLAAAAQAAFSLAYDADGADAHAQAARAARELRAASTLDARLAEPLAILEESLIGLSEAGSRLAAYLEALDADPARQEFVERRLAAIEELARKHRLPAQDVPDLLGRLVAERAKLDQSEELQGALDGRIAAALSRYRVAAGELTAARRAAARKLGSAVTSLMRHLGMPGGRFEAALEAASGGEPAGGGDERVEFLVSANPGQPVRPVTRVASGGELSRISLAVQVAGAAKNARTCMIFDEVDTGIGGGVAEIVGRKLCELGGRGQVLCVTHLAQVASQAHHQLRVTKLTDGRSSRTVVAALSAEERVEELARMLGGVEITPKAREHAREMLRAAAAAAR
ncbi:MAG: DNA repair protein RecN [Gammaproteobacteria bacterium]